MLDIPEIEGEKPIIKAIGVGGGGCNAVKTMYAMGIHAVDFAVIDMNANYLRTNPVPFKLCISKDGLGAGARPEVGRMAALDSEEVIRELIGEHTEMVFISATFGGGTGTGAAPVIANIAKSMGKLTVGIITMPRRQEGEKKMKLSLAGFEEMRQCVDSLVVISNEKVMECYRQATIRNAFAMGDNVIATAVRCISEIVTGKGYINVDMNDVKTTMTNSGDAIFGSYSSEGPDRAIRSIRTAIESPLLVSENLTGSNNVLLNISYSDDEPTMDEVDNITAYLRQRISPDADMIWGATQVDGLGDKLEVSIVATGQHISHSSIYPPSIRTRQSDSQSEIDEKPMQRETVTIDVAHVRPSALRRVQPSVQPTATQPPQILTTKEREEAVAVLPRRPKLQPMVFTDEDAENISTPPTITRMMAQDENSKKSEVSRTRLTLDDNGVLISHKNDYLDDRPD